MAETSVERKGITYAAVCHALVHTLELAYGVVLISMGNELGITLFVLGVLANVFGLAYGITALPMGVLADRISAPRLLGISSIVMGVAAVVVSLAHSTITLGVGLCVLGVALGVFHPVANAFVSKIATKLGLGFAYIGLGGNLGLAIGPIAVGAIAAAASWRAAYAAMAIPCILLGILFLRFRHVVATDSGPKHLESAPVSLREFLGPLIIVVTLGVLNGLIYRGVVTFLPTHLGANVHMEGMAVDLVLLGGSFTTFALLFGVGGQFLGGWLCDRWRSEWIVLMSTAFTIPALVAVWQMGNVALLAAAALFAFFHFMTQPVFNALIADYTPVVWRGRMFGAYFFSSLVVGSFSATGLGWVAETRGIQDVFMVCAVFAVLATVFSVPLVVWAGRRGRTFRVVDSA
ncbi:MAG: MFS transporter [Chloroflexota bacterium]